MQRVIEVEFDESGIPARRVSDHEKGELVFGSIQHRWGLNTPCRLPVPQLKLPPLGLVPSPEWIPIPSLPWYPRTRCTRGLKGQTLKKLTLSILSEKYSSFDNRRHDESVPSDGAGSNCAFILERRNFTSGPRKVPRVISCGWDSEVSLIRVIG